MVKILANAGADVNLRDKFSNTSLAYIAKNFYR